MLKLIRAIILFSLLFVAKFSFAQVTDSTQIQNVLLNQQKAWNNGNIELFMLGYWQSDSLVFIGKNGLTYGWGNTLANYKKSYPDANIMGKLLFTISQTVVTSSTAAYVIGKWQLDREKLVSGYFLLQFRKINDAWLIVADHTS